MAEGINGWTQVNGIFTLVIRSPASAGKGLSNFRRYRLVSIRRWSIPVWIKADSGVDTAGAAAGTGEDINTAQTPIRVASDIFGWVLDKEIENCRVAGWLDMKKRFSWFIMAGLLAGLVTAPIANAASGPSVVVHFNNNKIFLSDAEKDKLHGLFQTYNVRGEGRVFVLGYTDGRGSKRYNYKLSRQRAQAVRQEIISEFGIDATVVMAMGKGPENPIADNANVNGRARNRRAEIYLANASLSKPRRTYGPKDPHLPSIKAHLEKADELIRSRRIPDALRQLKQAHALGGDHYADWHTAMGIAGFYADAPADIVKAHLATALRLDPYNYKAREFLSRAQARQWVLSGKITPAMGRSVKAALPVTTAAQAHEYLHLFGVQALSHRKLDQLAMVQWKCRDPEGKPVTYYFDHSKTYSWAFGYNPSGAQPNPPSPKSSSGLAPSTSPVPASAQSKDQASEAARQTPSGLADNPRRIWQSTLYR